MKTSQRASFEKFTQAEVRNISLSKELEDLKGYNERLNEIINHYDTDQASPSSNLVSIKLQQQVNGLNAQIISMEEEKIKNAELSRKSQQEIEHLNKETIELQNALNIKDLSLQQIRRNDDSMSHKLQMQMEENDTLSLRLSASEQKLKDLEVRSSEECVFLQRRLSEYELLSECMDGINLYADDGGDELKEKNKQINELQIKFSAKDDDFRMLQKRGNKLKSEMDLIIREIQKRKKENYFWCKLIGFILFISAMIGYFYVFRGYGPEESVENLECAADDL